MKRRQSGQAVVEWAVVAFVLLLFALSLLALGQIVGQYMAVRSAASQAAFAAARAPSEPAAIQAGEDSAHQAMRGSQVESFAVRIEAGNFERGVAQHEKVDRHLGGYRYRGSADVDLPWAKAW